MSVPPGKILRKMGFLSDQKGIINRYFREMEGWESHLENTKGFIINHCSEIKTNPIKVAVLGSGWLLDVPLKFLSDKFKEVHLMDINHPRASKIKARNFSNVKFISTDITGGSIEKVFACVKTYKRRKEIPAYYSLAHNLIDFSEYDQVISLNILNQLDIIILDYLKKFNIYSEQDLKNLRKEIQQNHIESLPENKSCLISDVKEVYYNKKDEQIDKKSLIYIDLPKDKLKKTWTWKFDSAMTYYPEKKTYFNVEAYYL